MHAAYAAMAATVHKQRTGEGQLVEVLMFQVFSSFILLEHMGVLNFDPPNAPVGYARQIDPHRQPFPTADGWISIVAYADDVWARIFTLLGQPDFLDQAHLSKPQLRIKAQAELYQAIARFTPALTTEEILARCHSAQIPAQAVRDLGQVMDDPHLAAIDFFRRREHPVEGPTSSRWLR